MCTTDDINGKRDTQTIVRTKHKTETAPKRSTMSTNKTKQYPLNYLLSIEKKHIMQCMWGLDVCEIGLQKAQTEAHRIVHAAAVEIILHL